jgi:hypothetical protein
MQDLNPHQHVENGQPSSDHSPRSGRTSNVPMIETQGSQNVQHPTGQQAPSNSQSTPITLDELKSRIVSLGRGTQTCHI